MKIDISYKTELHKTSQSTPHTITFNTQDKPKPLNLTQQQLETPETYLDTNLVKKLILYIHKQNNPHNKVPHAPDLHRGYVVHTPKGNWTYLSITTPTTNNNET